MKIGDCKNIGKVLKEDLEKINIKTHHDLLKKVV